MATYQFTWPAYPQATAYRIYRAFPGQPYQLDQEIAQRQALVSYSLAPKNLQAVDANSHRTVLGWDPPLPGFPEAIKVVPVVGGTPLYTPTQDALWLSDALPTGASWEHDPPPQDPRRVTGSFSHRLEGFTDAAGHITWRLSGFSSYPAPGQYCVLWVCLLQGFQSVPDPQLGPNPACLYVVFQQEGSQDHRAYFGYDLLPWPEGTPAKRYMGELPAEGAWAGLVIRTSDVLVSAPVQRLILGVATKRPNTFVSLLLDSITIADQPVLPSPVPLALPAVSRTYRIERTGYAPAALPPLVAFSDTPTYIDTQVRDFSRRGLEDVPPLEISYDPLTGLTLTWFPAAGTGTDYAYSIYTVEANGALSPPATLIVSVNDAWSTADVYIDTTWITTQPPVASNLNENTYTYVPAQPDTLYFAKVVLKDASGAPAFVLERTYQTMGSPLLDSFILGVSRLG